MRRNNILDALFPRSRQLVLSTILLQPERRWYLSDLAHHVHVQPSSLQRELASLTEAGILRREPNGNRVYYRSEPDFPLFAELRGMFVKTTGLADTVYAVIEPFLERVDFAFIFGSLARGERTSKSDVDLMLVGSVEMIEVALPFRELERTLGVPVNVMIYTREEFGDASRLGNHFLQRVLGEPKFFLKGSEHELANAVGGPEDQNARHKERRA